MWTSTCRGENVTGEDHLYWTEMCRCLSREFTWTQMVKEIPRQGIVFAFPNTQFPEKEGKHSNLARFAHGIQTWLPTVSSETRLTSHSQCPSTSIQTYYTSWWVNEPCHWTLPRHHQPCWKSRCVQSKWNSKEQEICFVIILLPSNCTPASVYPLPKTGSIQTFLPLPSPKLLPPPPAPSSASIQNTYISQRVHTEWAYKGTHQ